MSTPLPNAPYNPPVSKVPILNSSSGNPKSFQDPKSIASIGNNIQAMADQAKADTLYDAPASKLESFVNPRPWIVNSQACRREAFVDINYNTNLITAALLAAAAGLFVCSIMTKDRRR
jgi:hypothetical protein